MLNVLSVLSIDNLFYSSKDKESGQKSTVLEVLKKYMPVLGGCHYYSDHLAKANLLQQYIVATDKKNFCKGNFVNRNNVKRAVQIREQLSDYLSQIIKERAKKTFNPIGDQQRTDKFVLSSEKVGLWLKCMEKGSVNNIAKLNREGNYTIVNSGQIASIHPESLLFFLKPKPNYVVFYQVIKTSKLYLRDVTALNI